MVFWAVIGTLCAFGVGLVLLQAMVAWRHRACETEAVRSLDASWISMDQPENPMVINGMVFFASRVSLKETVEHFKAAVKPYHSRRFKQIPRNVGADSGSVWQDLLDFKNWLRIPFLYAPFWEYAREFDVSDQIDELDVWAYYAAHISTGGTVPAAPTKQEESRVLREVLGHLTSLPLRKDRPLWHCFLIHTRHLHSAARRSARSAADGCDDSGYSMFCMRIHHGIADGISLMNFVLSTTTPVGGAEVGEEPLLPSKPHRDSRRTPPSVAHRLRSLLGQVLRIPLCALQLLFLTGDPATFLRYGTYDNLSGAAVTTWSSGEEVHDRGGQEEDLFELGSFAVPRVKRVAYALGGTINDVMMGLAAHALRRYELEQASIGKEDSAYPAGRYCLLRDDKQGPLNVKSFIPIGSLFAKKGDLELQNNFGFCFLSLPRAQRSARECVQVFKKEMDAMKESPFALMTYIWCTVFGAITAPIWMKLFTYWFASRGSVVLTNVRGPDKLIAMAGHAVHDMTFLVPRAGGIGLGISIFSYAGQISIGCNADTALFPSVTHLQRYLQLVYEVFAELERDTERR